MEKTKRDGFKEKTERLPIVALNQTRGDSLDTGTVIQERVTGSLAGGSMTGTLGSVLLDVLGLNISK